MHKLCSLLYTARILLFSGFVLALFLSYYLNFWRIANDNWFAVHQREWEGYVVGRMAKSRQDGIFSCGGLLGLGGLPVIPKDYAAYQKRFPMEFNNNKYIYKKEIVQFVAYEKQLPFSSFDTYNSVIGGQGIFFTVLDKLLPILPGIKLHLFHAITSFLLALALTSIILWFHLEFKVIAMLFVFISAFCSQWLVVFGRNFYWCLWAFYLPMVAIIYYAIWSPPEKRFNPLIMGIIVFSTVFIMCLFTGFAYITTSLIMTVVPLVYYGILEKWGFRKICGVGRAVALGVGLAIFLTLSILCLQIASIKGSFSDGINHIAYSLLSRTHASSINMPAEYMGAREAKSLQASTRDVLAIYLKTGIYFDINNYIYSESPITTEYVRKIRYSYLIVMFLLASGIVLFVRIGESNENRRKNLALLGTTWFSVLAPLSWLVIFKAHSYIHTHMNHVVWQMPFVFFGFALCGVATQCLWRTCRSIFPMAWRCCSGQKEIPIDSKERIP